MRDKQAESVLAKIRHALGKARNGDGRILRGEEIRQVLRSFFEECEGYNGSFTLCEILKEAFCENVVRTRESLHPLCDWSLPISSKVVLTDAGLGQAIEKIGLEAELNVETICEEIFEAACGGREDYEDILGDTDLLYLPREEEELRILFLQMQAELNVPPAFREDSEFGVEWLRNLQNAVVPLPDKSLAWVADHTVVDDSLLQVETLDELFQAAI